MARRWGYRIKKISKNEATVIFANKNYWGRSLAAISASTNPAFYEDFGPLMPLFDKVPYDDLNALELKFKSNPNICAFMMEPIQGEAGVIVPQVRTCSNDVKKKFTIVEYGLENCFGMNLRFRLN